jgi:ankyrin repeat protein
MQGRAANVEKYAYDQWYLVFKNRDLPGVVKTGETFLRTYPNGKYSEFVKRIIDFASISLDHSQQERAESVRNEVLTSLADDTEQLGSLLKVALGNEAEVNAKSRSGATALMFAALNGDREAVKSLIAKEADMNLAELVHGWTALVYAIWRGDKFIVEYMLEFDPDVRLKDKQGRTAMDHAKASGDFEMMVLMNRRPA